MSPVNIQTTFNSPFSDVGSLISTLLPNVIIFAAVIFFLLILYSGFELIRSAGGNSSPQELQKARDLLTFGIIGFLIVVSAYFILQLVSYMFFGSDTLTNSPVI